MIKFGVIIKNYFNSYYLFMSLKSKILFFRFGNPKKKGYYHPYDRKPPLQIGYMISLLNNEYTISFIDGLITPYSLLSLYKKTKKFNPDILVLSFTFQNHSFALKYAQKIKKILPHSVIICIGPHPSTQPETLIFKNSPIDFILLGECELELISLIKNINNPEKLKNLKSLYYKDKHDAEISLTKDLNNLPFPPHNLFTPKSYFCIYPIPLGLKLKWGFISSSRGCPHKCIFCSPITRSSYGSTPRFRSDDNILQEMFHLKSLGINIISFEDDNFTSSKDRVIKLCRYMINKKINLPWVAHARITDLSSSLMSIMKKAGCVLLRIGIESGSNKIIDILSKTTPNLDWNTLVKSILTKSKKIGLPIHTMFIIGNPKETANDLNLTIKLIKEIIPETLQIHYFTPYPGSKAFKTYVPSNKINKTLHHYNNDNILNLSSIDTIKLKKIQKSIYRNFYLNLSFFKRHISKYWRFYCYNPKILYEGLKGLF